MKDAIRVSEIFGPTVQGEGPLIGRPTVFLRTGGCDYRCSWCDTLYAVLPEYAGDWSWMTSEEVLGEIERLSAGKPILVSLSGGNPAMQPLDALLRMGKARGHKFSLETQGSLAKSWFSELDWLLLSPKPPSSEMETDWQLLQDCVDAGKGQATIAFKVVVFDEQDYAYAKDVASRYPDYPLYLQVGNPDPQQEGWEGEITPVDDEKLKARFRWLVERVAADKWYDVTVLPQLHVYAWGNMPKV